MRRRQPDQRRRLRLELHADRVRQRHPDRGETCDDGDLTSCDWACQINTCGNGLIDATEACDDGNLINGDGCDTNRTVTACGNGIKTAGEQCEDGNASSLDGCSALCQVE